MLKKCTFILLLLGVVGCDYVPNKTYEIETVDGETLLLSCPTVDPNRSKLTYFISNECRLIEN